MSSDTARSAGAAAGCVVGMCVEGLVVVVGLWVVVVVVVVGVGVGSTAAVVLDGTCLKLSPQGAAEAVL